MYSEKNLPVNDVSIKYDSLDILSPTNIKTDKKGLFILPKIILKNDLQAKRRISKLSSLIYITKKGYKKTTIDSKKFVKNEAKTNDTIDIGNIYLEKTNEDE
ncbi:hypothetical protein [Flavobacterium davisii]|uniref:hypothetical protein n=1 Tax=Flavobacterium davisii TaxID=2906077 RepID=UPI0035CF9909